MLPKLERSLGRAGQPIAPDPIRSAEKVAAAKNPSEGISALFGAPAIQALLKAQQEFKAKGYDLNLNG